MHRINTVLLSLSTAGSVLVCVQAGAVEEDNAGLEGDTVMTMRLTSPAFRNEGSIPAVYTCDGDDISPELNWSDVPVNAKGLVLIVDDPDAPDPTAPKMTWVHWVLYNIPADAT